MRKSIGKQPTGRRYSQYVYLWQRTLLKTYKELLQNAKKKTNNPIKN